MIKKIREKKEEIIIPQRDRKNIKDWRLEEYEMVEDGRRLNKKELEIKSTWEEKRSVSTTNRNKKKDLRPTLGRFVIAFTKEDDWLLVADW